MLYTYMQPRHISIHICTYFHTRSKHNMKRTWPVNTSNTSGAANAEIHILCQQMNATTLDGEL